MKRKGQRNQKRRLARMGDSIYANALEREQGERALRKALRKDHKVRLHRGFRRGQ